eukprot:COSAG02_NODE_16836_length_1052_cov_1.259182_1_plen_58_part_10
MMIVERVIFHVGAQDGHGENPQGRAGDAPFAVPALLLFGSLRPVPRGAAIVLERRAV